MPTPVDRLVRKEVALGAIREKQPPKDHIGLQLAPFLEVATDDVIFQYLKGGLQDGLSPARAEDAEAELAQKDELTYGTGRAAVIDWALKDKYTASDVTRYRDDLLVQQAAEGVLTSIPVNFAGSTVADFNRRLVRDENLRRRKLDNRIEQMIMTSLATGGYSYNDGRIKFTVDYGRPANQDAELPASGLWSAGTTHDPIGDILAMNDFMFTTYGVKLRHAVTSQKVLNTIWKSDRFTARTGLVVGGTPVSSPIDPKYLIPGWDQQFAVQAVEAATGVRFQVYDSVYRTRNIGSSTITNVRFTPENLIIFLPEATELAEIDDTEIGFGKTLTAPHPEGNWNAGFYEWEQEKTDPWMTVRGTGIKAFPVFPYMEYTYTMQAIT